MDSRSSIYKIILLFIIFVVGVIVLPKKIETFEQVKIKLKPNPINLNLNNNIVNGGNSTNCGSNYPDVIVPIYAPWRTYWSANSIYPYYPFYPYYYNNYFYY